MYSQVLSHLSSLFWVINAVWTFLRRLIPLCHTSRFFYRRRLVVLVNSLTTCYRSRATRSSCRLWLHHKSIIAMIWTFTATFTIWVFYVNFSSVHFLFFVFLFFFTSLLRKQIKYLLLHWSWNFSTLSSIETFNSCKMVLNSCNSTTAELVTILAP